MNVTCSATPCPIILNSTCVFYEGANLVYTGINTNDSLQTALEKIDARLAVVNGTSGTSGTSGSSGFTGTSGTNGTSGVSGTSGSSGTRGTSGTSGARGTSGTNGTNGTSGISGSSGTGGTSGTRGTSGSSGSSGHSGTGGTSGTSGYDGSGGTSGLTGTSGTSGTSGRNGSSGTTGTSGSAGSSGVSGTSGTSGFSGDKYATTSSTCLTIGLGTKNLTVDTNLAYSINQKIIIAYSAGNEMNGDVLSYNPSTGALSVNVTSIVGSGNYCSWEVNLGGVAGAAGSSGTSGSSGFNGTSGTTGTSGSSGNDGTSGSSGKSGTSGSTGTSGIDGSHGTSGSSGSSGSDGSSGTSGSSGIDGTTGTSGTSGTDGTSGIDGTSGTSGANGFSAGQLYYFNQSLASDIAPYRELSITPISSSQVNTPATTSGAIPVLISEFITPQLGFSVIPGGNQYFHLHYLKGSAGYNIDTFVTIQLADSSGTPIGPLLQTNSAQIGWIDNVTPVEEIVDLTLPTTTVDPTNRMIVKIWVIDQAAGSHPLTWYTEGTQYYSFVITSVGAVSGTSGTSGTSGIDGQGYQTVPFGATLATDCSLVNTNISFYICEPCKGAYAVGDFVNLIDGNGGSTFYYTGRISNIVFAGGFGWAVYVDITGCGGTPVSDPSYVWQMHLTGAQGAAGTSGTSGTGGGGGGVMVAGTGTCSIVGSGDGNSAFGNCSFVASGSNNIACTDYSMIIGGGFNSVLSSCSTILNGYCNQINSSSSVILSGAFNNSNAFNSVIGSGNQNSILYGSNGFIGAGTFNCIFGGPNSFIGTGFSNTATSFNSFIGTGCCNNAGCMGSQGCTNSVFNGAYNNALGSFSSIENGCLNTVSAFCSMYDPTNYQVYSQCTGSNSFSVFGDYTTAFVSGKDSCLYDAFGSNCLVPISSSCAYYDGLYCLTCVFVDGAIQPYPTSNYYNTNLIEYFGGQFSTIENGTCNTICTSKYGVIQNGRLNTLNGYYNTIHNGVNNIICTGVNNTHILGSGISANCSNTTYVNGLLITDLSAYSGCSVCIGVDGKLAQSSGGGGGGGIMVADIGLCSTVRCGVGNVASGDYSFSGGGSYNCAVGINSFVGGGGCSLSSFMGNAVDGNSSSVVGGLGNRINFNSNCSFIGGGQMNNILPDSSRTVIVGGAGNQIMSFSSFSFNSSIVGGGFNRVCDSQSVFIGGGDNNCIINSSYTSIVGGIYNTNASIYGSILGGCCNDNPYPESHVIGSNISATRACTTFVNDLIINSACACSGCGVCVGLNGLLTPYTAGGGGSSPMVSDTGFCSIRGNGFCNSASGDFSFVGGGCGNYASGTGSFIGSGVANPFFGGHYVTGYGSSVVGGESNIVYSDLSHIAGGCRNCISQYDVYGFIGSGAYNCLNSNPTFNSRSSIVGGQGNWIAASCAFIGGGSFNTNCGTASSIVGGNSNYINSFVCNSAILGGQCSQIYHNNSFVLGSNIFTSANDTTYVNNLNSSCNIIAVQGSFCNSDAGGSIGSVKNLTLSNFAGNVGDWAGLNFAYYNNATNFGYVGTVITSGASNAAADMVFGVKSSNAATCVSETMRISGGALLVGKTTKNSFTGPTPIEVAGELVAYGSYAGVFFENRLSSNIFGFYGSTNLIVYNTDFGNIGQFAYSNGAYTALSDVNKKKDFEESTIGLNAILGLKPTLYRMKTDNENADKHLGFIAQEVKPYIPQAYVENGESDDKFIGLQDRPMIAALVKGMQEQQQQIEELKTRLINLENK